MIESILIFVVGFGLGCMFYRYMLRTNPAKLEQWAAEIRAKTQSKS